MDAAIRTLALDDPAYPALLHAIPDPPPTLYVRGTLPRRETGAVAIVGTRKATSEGMALARELGEALARRGIVIVSGLALGIDGASHEGALRGGGVTLAVLGNGVDAIYPPTHESLGRQMLASGGALISEYPPGTPSLPHHFLARNRIISGLSHAVVLVEAPIHSGSLATARHALTQGREVFVTPGPARHPHYRGSHMLVREGARLVTSAADILEDLASTLPALAAPEPPLTPPIEDAEGHALYDALQRANEPLTIDKLAELTTLEPQAVSRALSYLIVEGLVEERQGKFTTKR